MSNILDVDGLDKLIDEFMADSRKEKGRQFEEMAKKTLDPLLYAVELALDGGDSWVESQAKYSLRKAREMRIGTLKEDLFGLLPDWEVMPREDALPDLVCENKKIIVELKSRSNTVKGENKPAVYDKLLGNITGQYRGYTALYGFYLNDSRKSLGSPQPFAPSDNRTQQRRNDDQRIRQVDGKVLWAIAADPNQGVYPPYSIPEAMIQVYSEVIDAIERHGDRAFSSGAKDELISLTARNFSKDT